jgi:hypothetical protein
VIWTTERNRAQGELVADLSRRASEVPCESTAIIACGLRGADFAAVLASAGVDRSQYLVISLDAIKEEMAVRGLIPHVEGLSPMEASELVHAESAYIAKRLGLRAIADSRNILWEITMASVLVAESWLDALDRAGYTTGGIYVDVPIEESVRRSDAEHRRKQEEYRNGRGYGGRYVPAEAIRAMSATERRGAGQQVSVGTATGGTGAAAATELIGLIDRYASGQLTLEELARRFRGRNWPSVPGAWTSDLEEAASAIDDPAPYVPGSFDDVVLAYDLGRLSDQEYDILAAAAAASRRATDRRGP